MAARGPPDEKNHERLYIQVHHEERRVMPPVQLARQEIRMTYLPSEQQLPCIITTTSASQGKKQEEERIVGTEVSPLGKQSTFHVPAVVSPHGSLTTTTVMEMASTTTTSTSKQLTMEYKSAMAVQHVEMPHAHVLEFFEEQGKSVQEQQHHSRELVPQQVRPTRSPSPSAIRQSIGLDHLDNLVKLMEQLSTLRDENLKLKKKCEYLESTKHLLQIKSAVESEIGFLTQGYNSLPKTKSKTKSKGRTRPRLPSAEDVHSLDSIEVHSESSIKKPKSNSLSKRSFSTGSIDIPSDIMEQSGEDEMAEKMRAKSYEKRRNSRTSSKTSKSPSTKRKKTSNWSKIIKVITRQKAPDDFGISVKTKKDFHAGSLSSPKELTVPPSAVDGRSVDSGVGSGLEADGTEGQRKSTSSAEPMSPPPSSKEDSKSKQLDELPSDIWMGPPEWLEEHEDEFSKEIAEPCEKEIIVLKSLEKKDDHLQIPIMRRKSSPSLLEDNSDESSEEDENYLPLRRSSSYKIPHNVSDTKDQVSDSPKIQKKHKTPLGKVGKMFHARKDSIKKQLIKKSGHKSLDVKQSGEESSEMDYLDSYEDDGPIGRSTPKTSPALRQRVPELGDSPPTNISALQSSPPGGIDVSLLLGGMSDEFSKKMKEWDERQTTKRLSATLKEPSEGSENVFSEHVGAVSPEFQKKLEEWERTKSLKCHSKQPEEYSVRDSREGSPEGTSTPPEIQSQAINIEDMQKKLTDSFNRKMEEWEKQKYRFREGSPGLERKDSSGKKISRKEDRQKSKKTKEEKDKGKLERQRERELQRVEREQHKLEKERMRLEKERLKALEREARIEKMKGRLSQPDMESKFKNPILSPLAEYKVTTDFARKLHEWEIRKGQPGSVATYLEAQQRSMEQSQSPESVPKKESNGVVEETTPVRKISKGQKPPPLTLMPCSDSPEEVSPGARSRSSVDSFGEDNTSVTMESMTEANISSLEKANARLLEELQEKESEYANLQEEVRDLNDKLNKARVQHSKDLEQYKECLAGGAAIQPISPIVLSSQLTDLESKIQELKNFGENLAVTMESAAVCKWQSVEGEENVNCRLMDLLEKMRLMLLQASESEEVYQKSSALHSFEKLYSQAMQLQVQLSNLRLSQIERNKEIMSMKRQLLLQEANNLLLQADITRRETELLRYKQYAKKNPGLKRWNTYGGMEGRVVEGKEAESIPPYKRFTKNLANKSAVNGTEDILEASEPSTSDTSKDDSMIVKTEDLCIQTVEPHSDTSSSFTESSQSVHSSLPPSSTSAERVTVKKVEMEHIENVPENLASKVVVPAQDNKNIIHSDKGMEISLTIKLPSGHVSTPRDLSQHELAVPRSQRGKVVDSEKLAVGEIGEINESNLVSGITEMKFPELLIPDWKKTPEKVHLQKVQQQEVEDSMISSSVPSVASQPQSEPAVADSSQSDSGNYTFISADKIKVVPVDQESTHSDIPSSTSDKTHQNKRHTFPRVMDTCSDPDIASKPYLRQTSVTISPLIGRRTYESSIHWPRIKHVTSANRIKPAEELLEESRRYRKGHSIYMTRILQKYALSEESKKYFDERQLSFDKENFAHGYVKTIVQRLSREGTPDSQSIKSGSDISVKQGTALIHRTDSPRTGSEFVQQIVRKLSSPSGPSQTKSGTAPLKDLTNGVGVKKLAEVFDSGRNTPEKVLSDPDSKPYKSVLVTSLKHKDLGHISFDSSSSSSTVISSNITGYHEDFDPYDKTKPDSTISTAVVNFSSMPLLSVEEEPIDTNNGYRERAATTTTCDISGENGSRGPTDEIHALSDSDIACASSSKRHISQKTIIASAPESARMEIIFPHRLTEKRSGKIKMGTIGLLCQQTMLSFDLGLTMKAEQQQQKEVAEVKLRKKSEGEEKPRPLSVGSDTSLPPDDKKKSKSRFFESSWLQKPKRFFKVSKC